MEQLRTSSYVIYVNVGPTSDGMNTLLVHGYSGAYDRVSDNVARFLQNKEVKRGKPLYGEWGGDERRPDTSRDDISKDALAILRRRGYITSLSVSDEELLFKKFVTILHKRARRSISYIMIPTYNCNLRCFYCFQDYMRSDSADPSLLQVMSSEMVDRLFLGMQDIERHHEVDQQTFVRSITLFGGEPLLASSLKIVEYIIAKAKGSGRASFSAVTNATELDAYCDLLGPDKISSIQVTLDGPPDEHDKRRVYADGAGSFDRIATNITMALDKGVAVSVRNNLDRNNIRDVPRLAVWFQKLGWTTRPNFSAYSSPISASNETTDKKVTFGSWEADTELTRLRRSNDGLVHIQRPDDRIVAAARRIFSSNGNGVTPSYRESFCGAHTGMYIFDAFADIYACWERTGGSHHRIGHVSADGTVAFYEPQVSQWRNRTVASNSVCSKCKYGLQCGGGCAVMAQSANGSAHTNYCDGFATRFKASVAEAYRDHIAGKSVAAVERPCG